VASNVTWDGPAVQAAIRAEMHRRVVACSILIERHAKELLSVAGTFVATNGVRLRAKDGTFRRVYGSNPSAPGEAPHKQTGHLRRSVTREVIGLAGRVGTNLNYGRWLELGTRLVAARPWLRPSLAAVLGQIRAILAAPMTL